MAQKEDKYLVLKLDDLHMYLTPGARLTLDILCDLVAEGRAREGKEKHPQYVVCNQDEPYAAKVWNAILEGEDAKA